MNNATEKQTALQSAKAEIKKEGIKLSNMCDPSDCRVAMRELIKIQKRHGLMDNKGLNSLYLNLGQNQSPGQFRSPQISTQKGRIPQIGPGEIRSPQIAKSEISPGQIGFRKVCPGQYSFLELRFFQVCPGEVPLAQPIQHLYFLFISHKTRIKD